MLNVKFFTLPNGNSYVKTRHDNNVVDTTAMPNIAMMCGDYIKNIMQWGYSRSEITFTIDPTVDSYDAEEITRAIELYAD